MRTKRGCGGGVGRSRSRRRGAWTTYLLQPREPRFTVKPSRESSGWKFHSPRRIRPIRRQSTRRESVLGNLHHPILFQAACVLCSLPKSLPCDVLAGGAWASGASAPSSQPVLPDEILGEIFLRLDSVVDLARASAACSAFLRVVRFLRRNRPLYRPAVVVFLESEGPPHFHHPDPQCSASAARALAEAADFTLSSLPDAGSWMIWDASGGRLLLSRPAADAARFPDLVVCDPLHRRHVRIPPVPAGLASGSGAIRLAYLTQTGVEEQVEGSSLVVVWMMMVRFKSKVTALVFSSATREWRRVDFNSWRLDFAILTACRHHPQRSLCRTSGSFSEVLMLDTRKMEFSVMRVPRVRVCRQQAIVEAGEGGRLSFLTLGDGVLDLYCEAGQGDGVGAQEWQHERRIPLPGGLSYSYTFSGVGGGYLLLQVVPQDWVEPADHVPHMPEIHYFTLKLKTLLVERLCVLNKRVSFAHLYANFLPPLSLPSV